MVESIVFGEQSSRVHVDCYITAITPMHAGIHHTVSNSDSPFETPNYLEFVVRTYVTKNLLILVLVLLILLVLHSKSEGHTYMLVWTFTVFKKRRYLCMRGKVREESTFSV